MHVNTDFTRRVVMHGAAMPWVDSPVPGVQRRMLDRIGGEVARATSIVRYAPGSAFSPHIHEGGEEFIVLEGVFSDEHADHPAGTYVRNPPTTRHTPRSALGCVIFVKLWQFDPTDRTPLVVDTERVHGEAVLLFEDERETVRLLNLAAHATLEQSAPDGAELLVLRGGLREGDDALQPWSWLRVPRGGRVDAVAGTSGARVWMKTRHLRDVHAPASAGPVADRPESRSP